MVEELKQLVHGGELDYNLLISWLNNHNYQKPRDYISKLLKQEYLIRVKKGLYVFGPRANGPLYSKEILANLIYGPSYISKEYALAYYGLIPEMVTSVTSMTPKRNKDFYTPIGHFAYKYIAPTKYIVGLTNRELSPRRYALFASPEKALADMFSGIIIKNTQELESFLYDDLRIEPKAIATLRPAELKKIQKKYKSGALALLLNQIEELS